MRDSAVTYSKAIAMFLVVLGHAFSGSYVNSWVNMFHVPVFFFLSGYCFKEKYLDDFKTFVIKKVRGIYLPFLIWSLFFLVLHNLLFKIGIYNSSYSFAGGTKMYSISELLLTAKDIALRMSNPEPLLGPFWFLESLFVGLFIFYFALFINKKVFKHSSFFFSGIILISLSLLANVFHKAIYLLNYRELMTAFFIWAGFAYKKFDLKIHLNKYIWLVSILLISIGCVFWKGEAAQVSWTRELPYVITALFGSIMTLGIATYLNRQPFRVIQLLFEKVGNNTMSIFTWHFTSFLIVSEIIIIVFGLSHQRIAECPVIQEYASKGWGILYLLVGIVVPLLLVYCKDRIKSLMADNWSY